MVQWQEEIRRLWTDFLFWIRYYIISLMFGLQDFHYVASRVLRNATAFAVAFVAIYGETNAGRMGDLLVEHVLLLTSYVTAVRTGRDTEPVKAQWMENANQLADFLSGLNPYWDKNAWMELLQERFGLEERLILRLQQGDFLAAVNQFDAAHSNAERITSYMLRGIALQFGENLPVQSGSMEQSGPDWAQL